MLSLLGFPGTGGFIGKWYILSAVIESRQAVLAVVLVGATVISAGYYLPVIMAMFMKPPAFEGAHEHVTIGGVARWVVAGTAVVLLLLGVWPGRTMDVARQGGEALRPTISLTVSR